MSPVRSTAMRRLSASVCAERATFFRPFPLASSAGGDRCPFDALNKGLFTFRGPVASARVGRDCGMNPPRPAAAAGNEKMR